MLWPVLIFFTVLEEDNTLVLEVWSLSVGAIILVRPSRKGLSPELLPSQQIVSSTSAWLVQANTAAVVEIQHRAV